MRIVGYLLVASFVGLGVLCVLPTSAPYSRWKLLSLVNFSGSPQTYYDYTTGTGAPSASVKARLEQIRRAYPNDFAVQWALAIWEGASDLQRTREQLLALRERFPHRPEVYASLLRNEMRQFPLGREEDHRFTGDNTPSRPAIPTAVQRLLEWAQQGERLDPENAFFTGMRVRALLAQRRDAEAVRALQRAAELPRWDDHLSAEAEASVQFQRRLHNLRSGDLDLALSTTILFPHYATERSIARILTFRAWELERQGKYREALAIRRVLARYGQRLTAGGNILRTLVGVALIQIAATPPRTDETLTAAQRQQRFLAALERNGFENEARWFRAELERTETIRSTLQKATPALYDEQIMPAPRRYYGQLLSLFGLMGLSAILGVQWLTLWLAQRMQLGTASVVLGLLIAWLTASLLFILSDAGALMGRMVASMRTAEQLISGQEVGGWSPAPLRWALPAGTATVGLLLTGLAAFYAVVRRPDSPEGAVAKFHAAIGVLFAMTLVGLSLLTLLNMRADVALEQFASGLRHDEVGMALRAAGLAPTLPPPTP